MAKKKAVRTTITVPDGLKRRMDRVSGVNWSALAAAAFEAELAAIAQRRKGLDMEAIRDRLAASKAASHSSSYKNGHAYGTDWASREATYVDLKRITEFCETQDYDNVFGDSVDWRRSPLGPATYFAQVVLGDDVEASEADELWDAVFGDHASDIKDDTDVFHGLFDAAAAIFRDAGV